MTLTPQQQAALNMMKMARKLGIPYDASHWKDWQPQKPVQLKREIPKTSDDLERELKVEEIQEIFTR